ncbi:MAG: WbqC family protein [Candidatus Aminicenantes bacterium]|nr:WbqC family protein [Candidatus Aminicenantes bacterium]
MKKVAIIQSSYIPWKGYFDIIHDVDCFIFLDDVQYTNRDWRNRNKIKTNSGERWLSIPLGNHRDRLINKVEFNDLSWREKHLKTIEQFYRTAEFFGTYFGLIREYYYQQEWLHLYAFNQNFIKRFSSEILGLKTAFLDSAAINVKQKKLNKIIGLVEAVNGDYYLSGPLARNYLNESEFGKRHIELCYKDYAGYPEYKQSYPPFSHYVSVLDLLFHVGDRIPYYIWQWRENANIEP